MIYKDITYSNPIRENPGFDEKLFKRLSFEKREAMEAEKKMWKSITFEAFCKLCWEGHIRPRGQNNFSPKILYKMLVSGHLDILGLEFSDEILKEVEASKWVKQIQLP